MPFFDAHCDTIGPIWEGSADFMTGKRDGAHGLPGHGADGSGGLHVTLPGLRSAGICAQVFACWAWSQKYKDNVFEAGLGKVDEVDRLCDHYAQYLFLARTGAEVARACRQAVEAEPDSGHLTEDAGRDATVFGSAAPDGRPKTAVIASLEGADPLEGDVDNLDIFFDAGVRLITLAWGDNDFTGSTYDNGGGLTAKGADLVMAMEERGVLVDVSHASDKAFWDVCQVAKRPFLASHSNCRELCPAKRNLTDEMIRALAERGGVMGITLAPSFLSKSFLVAETPLTDQFREALIAGSDEAMRTYSAAVAAIPRPGLEVLVDHVVRAIKVGGEDAVGLGGDLDGVEVLPADFSGAADYPRIARALRQAGLNSSQVDKICYGNFARLFEEGLP
jgi:microsomal dipeptidase-like Zn-dependent dipeptidase